MTFNILTNGTQKPFNGMGNNSNPSDPSKNNGDNNADTNTNRVNSAMKSNATPAKAGGKFKAFIKQ